MKHFSASLLVCCLLIAPVTALSPSLCAQAMDARKTQADQLYREADFHLKSNAFQAAQLKLEQAFSLYQQLGDTTGQKDVLTSLGVAIAGQTYYQEALRYLAQAEAIAGDTSQQGRIWTEQGFVYLELGEYRQAHYLFLRSQGSQVQNIDRENRNRIGIGEAYRYLGMYSQALPYLKTAENASGDRNDYGRALNALGDIYFELAQYQEAQSYYQKAISIRQSLGDRLGTSRTLNNLGRIERALKNFPEALKFYQQSLNLVNGLGDKAGKAIVLNNMGQVALDMGLNNQALKYFQEALAESRNVRTGLTATLNNLGLYYRKQGDFAKAIESYQEALGWARKTGDGIGEIRALSGLGETRLEMKQTDEAIKPLQESIEKFETLRPGLRDEDKISLFDTQAVTYRTLQTALVARQDYATALAVAERSRARAFVELMAQRVNVTEVIVNALNFADIQAIAKNKQATLVTYSLLYDEFDRESGLYIWVVDPQGKLSFKTVALPKEQQNKQILTNLVVSLRTDGIKKAPANSSSESLTRKTYDILIQPIADLLPTDPEAQIIFIPQGSLFLVPFQALQDASGKFLIEKHTIIFAPSIQSLSLNQKQQTPKNKSLSPLIVGNPEPMPNDLSPLPGAATEANAIAQLLRTEAITGTQATETLIAQKITQAGIIHFATHGLLNEQETLESSLAFAPSPERDGLMTAADIFDLKLQADLAVLSACDTGRGKITGDGVLGLSRSLLSAGVNSVVVSLWEVPDQPTSSLMVEFYRNLQSNPDKAKALRQAMLAQMKKTPTPNDWAAFILLGTAD
jgi:CHAT domain-containing protein/Tfp pilus assembly protein PilF